MESIRQAGQLRRDRSRGDTALPGRSLAIDALRAAAAIGVVGMHANYLVTPGAMDALTAIRFSLWSGVDLFFAISGYLITRPFIRALITGSPLPRTTDYLVRRAARLLPAYWVALAVMFVVALSPPTARTMVLHAFMLHDLVPGEAWNFYPLAWTLGAEAMFYLFVPAVVTTVRWRVPRPVPRRALFIAVLVMWTFSAALSLVIYNAAGPDPTGPAQVAAVSLPALLFLFCPGILLALAVDVRSQWPPLLLALANPVVGLPAGVAVWLMSVALNMAHTPTSTFIQDQLLALASGSLILVAVAPVGGGRSTIVALAGRVGRVSYGIYLWHWIVLLLLLRFIGLRGSGGAGNVQWLTMWGTLVTLALVPATVSWIWVERPAIEWSTGRKPRAEGAAAAGSN